MIMLSEQLEKKSKIGTIESIAYIAHWLSTGTDTIDDMVKCVQGQANIKISEVKPILGLFEIMSLIKFDGTTIKCSDTLAANACNDKKFLDWFTTEYVDFVISHNFISLDGISYSIAKNKYVLSPTAINPRKYACYRNLLIDLGIIEYCPDGGYLINRLLDHAILKVRDKKISEEELLDNLERQKEQGKEGEEFALAYERSRITNTALQCKIERISIIDVSAGFDIVSFNDNDSKTFDRFIEVKTYVGKPHFYWSKNEIEKARLMGDAYFIYLIDFQKIGHKGYMPQCISNPIKNIIQTTEWMKTSQAFLVELLTVDGYSKQTRRSMHLQDGDNSQDELDTYLSSVSVVQSFVDIAIRLGIDSMHALETILSRVNDENNGIYRGCLAKLRDAADNSKTNVGTTIGRLENYGTVNNISGKSLPIAIND